VERVLIVEFAPLRPNGECNYENRRAIVRMQGDHVGKMFFQRQNRAFHIYGEGTLGTLRVRWERVGIIIRVRKRVWG